MTNDIEREWRWATGQDEVSAPKPKPVKSTDKLEDIFDMQHALDQRIIDDREVKKSLDEWVIGLTIAIESEIDEIRREVNWKWWKNPKEVDVGALQGEVIDLVHFTVSLAQKVGLTADDVYEVYRKKNEENHARQDGKSTKEGYAVITEEEDEDYVMIDCEMCFEHKEVENGTRALDAGMCEPCYCQYQGG